MVKDIKDIVAKIKIAQKMNKKEIEVVKTKTIELSLNFLWREGFIYGYAVWNSFFYKVFVKYSVKGFSALKNTVFCNKKVSSKKLYSIGKLENNSSYFLLNDKGFLSHKKAVKLGLGGLLFVKI